MTADGPWLSIVGMGADGRAGLSPSAAACLQSATHIFGGKRHLQMLGPMKDVTLHKWARPIDESLADIEKCRGMPTVVLASGDPFFYGVGSMISAHFHAENISVYPSVSCISQACSRLQWSIQDTRVLSICGRDVALIRPHLQPGARLLILSADKNSPAELRALLMQNGFGESDISIMEQLGGSAERIRSYIVSAPLPDDITDLNLVALNIKVSPSSRVMPLTSGLDDSFFLNDGQMTKQEIRALTLSALTPTQGALLWDVGAGSGSIAIEWMLRHPSNQAVAFEKCPSRLARIIQNAHRLGVPNLIPIQAEMPVDAPEMTAPDAIFVGGGVSRPHMLSWAYKVLRPGGRLVANAVTLESEVALAAAYQDWGGTLIRINIARADPIGGFQGFRPTMTVTQYAVTKP